MTPIPPFPALDEANFYAQIRSKTNQPHFTAEPTRDYHTAFQWSERHLQCIWFDRHLRPDTFPTDHGETVTILDPGVWNLEAGPDFLGATLLIQPGARQIRGDVEIHVKPRDWVLHHHAEDPAYQHVIAHVTWFSGPPPEQLPLGTRQIAFSDSLNRIPGFSFDDIDVRAYPHAIIPQTPCPCAAFLTGHPDRAERLLTAAGQYRLRTKALRLLTRLQQTGDRAELFYEEVMAALGYKQNQTAFRELARRIPFASLRNQTREEAFARLAGMAGLLPEPDSAPDDETRKMIRAAWDFSWKHMEENGAGDPIRWRMAGIRPPNAPIRRLAAAAALFTGSPALLETVDALRNETGMRWISQVADCFASRCRWPFWLRRLSIRTPPDPNREIALLGASRISAITSNLLLPMALAENRWPEKQLIRNLPSEELSAPMRETAWRLFGRDHNPALYEGNGLRQQGLLQIHLDFCLNARPHCEGCRLQAALQSDA